MTTLISTNAPIELSLIILNFRSAPYLEKCLATLFDALGTAPYEIIVVNNDATPLDAVKNKFPQIITLENGQNVGFGKANNLGARLAKGRIIGFINPDTEIQRLNVEELTEFFKKNSDVGILGAELLSTVGKAQYWSAGYAPTLIDTLLNNLRFIRSKRIWNSTVSRETDWVSGAALFARKNVFESLNGFDEKFFMYFEDVDLCTRARKNGWKVVYFPKIKILHYGGKSSNNNHSIKPMFYKSQDYYFQKHQPNYEGWILKFLRKFSW